MSEPRDREDENLPNSPQDPVLNRQVSDDNEYGGMTHDQWLYVQMYFGHSSNGTSVNVATAAVAPAQQVGASQSASADESPPGGVVADVEQMKDLKPPQNEIPELAEARCIDDAQYEHDSAPVNPVSDIDMKMETNSQETSSNTSRKEMVAVAEMAETFQTPENGLEPPVIAAPELASPLHGDINAREVSESLLRMEDERQTETETADLDAQEHEETVSQGTHGATPLAKIAHDSEQHIDNIPERASSSRDMMTATSETSQAPEISQPSANPRRNPRLPIETDYPIRRGRRYPHRNGSIPVDYITLGDSNDESSSNQIPTSPSRRQSRRNHNSRDEVVSIC
ncbi:AT hook, DNA-binding motif-containing protein [Caenorhabditis elegans]|uniref:AT hook, DNA-binding motif-containing protein n=1 Tax=Caenorhabditis elegans TaxID=6239 RepID=A0A5E4LXS9_CAEEL|nr:AT hook, DNA-binding motif-containing protein [Caenorhabditis elegans]VVC12362.1 AT hook, DNA-binding motif-containing protein [Caenorhabditis elegans]